MAFERHAEQCNRKEDPPNVFEIFCFQINSDLSYMMHALSYPSNCLNDMEELWSEKPLGIVEHPTIKTPRKS